MGAVTVLPMSESTNACVLGLGSMGSALALRLREQGVSISVWNRTRSKAVAISEQQLAGSCTVANSAQEAVSLCAADSLVILMVVDTSTAEALLRTPGVGAALRKRTLLNLVSANPDEARKVAALVTEVSDGECLFIDGAYCGNPTKARSGTGQLFLSSAKKASVDAVEPTLSMLGSVCFAGDIGASRALDYAVVDLFFVNALSFFSNMASLQKEGVDLQQFFGEAAKRLATVPAVLDLYSERMATRDEDAYCKEPTCTLSTARSYWASRLPYNSANKIPTHLTDFMIKLIEDAGGAPDGPHPGADLSRLQEVVRYGAESDQPPHKKAKREI